MDEKTPIGNSSNEPKYSKSVDLELSPPTSTNMKTLDRSRLLDTISACIFTILKICIFTLLLLAIFFIFFKIYTGQEGT